MTYKHIKIDLPLVPLGNDPDNAFKQDPEAEREYRLAYAAPELLAIMKELAFVVESVAHLQGKERELLPFAERARALQDRLEK